MESNGPCGGEDIGQVIMARARTMRGSQSIQDPMEWFPGHQAGGAMVGPPPVGAWWGLILDEKFDKEIDTN